MSPHSGWHTGWHGAALWHLNNHLVTDSLLWQFSSLQIFKGEWECHYSNFAPIHLSFPKGAGLSGGDHSWNIKRLNSWRKEKILSLSFSQYLYRTSLIRLQGRTGTFSQIQNANHNFPLPFISQLQNSVIVLIYKFSKQLQK